jgi:hypothetical protein
VEAEGHCCGLAGVVLLLVQCYELLEVSLEVRVVADQLHYPGLVVEEGLILDSEEAVVPMTCVHQ